MVQKKKKSSKKSDKSQAADEEVGYGNPPKKHQFPPGQSGNPGGRPKKSAESDPDKMLVDLLNEKMPAKIGGEMMTISMKEAILRKTIHDALNGNNAARKLVFEKMAKVVIAEDFEFDPVGEQALQDLLKQLPNQNMEKKDDD